MARRPERGATPRRRRRPAAARERRAPRPARSGAEPPRTGRPPSPPLLYLLHHGQAAAAALARLRRAPLHSALTAAVLGIALALPAAFWVALESAERAAGGWTDGAARISLFLERDTGQAAVEARAAELAARPEIAGTETISPEQALATLRERSDFDAALELLDRNPLPPVIVARVSGERDPGAVAALAERLAEAPYVERMRLDQQWLERLHALVALAERALGVLTALLAVAVVLVVGNTIRLTIESRREEIGIVKLIGGSDGFVRRPFLYEGLGYGLAGGALAWALAEAVRWAVAGPAQRVAEAYAAPLGLAGLGLQEGAMLLAGGGGLGLAGAWLAVARHLAAIEPR